LGTRAEASEHKLSIFVDVDLEAYLSCMREKLLVQFVCFETILNSEEFIVKWQQFNRSVDNLDITLQQSQKNGVFKYIIQQRCSPDQFQFIFEKKRKSSKIPEVSIKTEQAGGYSIRQQKRKGDTKPGEVKVFTFLSNPLADLDSYEKIPVPADLNIYEPYFENCRYAYILEFFTDDQSAESLIQELANRGNDKDSGVYKECSWQ
jgi:hypothetical protein